MSVRVLSYPPVHDYVDRLHPTSAELVRREEPWPELRNLYDPSWLRAHAGDWDVAHLHFTFEQYPPERLAEVLAAHHASNTPVVWTAHDLRNPHTPDPSRDRPYLELLAERADHVITLTDGAAAELEGRFARRAEVIPHGPLFSGPSARRWRARRADLLEDRERRPVRVLLHLRGVRTNVDWRTPMQVVADLDQRGSPVELRVLVLGDSPRRSEIVAAAGAGVTVHVHGPLPFEALTEQLIAADALLLPYRWGTHSGMLEVATDLALPVIAGDVGYLSEQAPLWGVPVREDVLDPEELARQLERLLTDERPPVVPVDRREQLLFRFRSAHEALYRRLTAGQPAGTSG